MWLTDPKDKQPSVTLTLFVGGFIICLLKLIGSGIVIGPITLSPFSGVDFAAAVGALGGVYALRRSNLMQDNIPNEPNK